MRTRGGAKLAAPLAAPSNYFELTFTADAGRPYRLWIRGKADNNSYANDSVFVQFSDSVDAAGAAAYRIGTTTATDFNLEACSGCGLSGWGWEDNGWGPNIARSRASTSPRPAATRCASRRREDGLAIDQVVLSAERYLSTSPGATKNDTVILAKSGGSTPPPPPPPSGEIVLHAATAPTVVGSWTMVNDATAASGRRLYNPNAGAAKVVTRAGQPGDLLRVDVQRGGRQAVSAVDSRPGRQQQLRERFGARAVLGQRQRTPARRSTGSAPRPRPSSTSRRAADAGCRTGAGRTTAGAPACSGRRSISRRPAHRRFESSRARTASRSTRSCCPPPPT